jgi:hypothetical protein
MTYLALSKTNRMNNAEGKKMFFPFVDIVATPKGETHLKLSYGGLWGNVKYQESEKAKSYARKQTWIRHTPILGRW